MHASIMNNVDLEVSDSRRISRFREISPNRKEEFLARGLPERHFFPHRAYYLPKCGPDALKLGRRMCGGNRLDLHWEVLLYAHPSLIEKFPSDLFFDDDLIWHRQQLNKPGHIGFAYLVVKNGNLYGLNYVSDLVQRISRRRSYKTRIEKVFKGWHHMLLNSVMNFAVENSIARICSPTAAFVIKQTDPERTVQKRLFERVYDEAVQQHFSVTKQGDWWLIDVEANRERLVVPAKAEEALPNEKTICISHDIERGFGHLGIDAQRAQLASRIAPSALAETLRCEEAVGLKTTYNVLGCFFDEVRGDIERYGHCLAFHSYDHQVRNSWLFTKHYYRVRRVLASVIGGDHIGKYQDQLYRCRVVDRRIRGFRPPQSRSTAEWTDYNLVFRNFEWYATSSRALGTTRPVMQDRLVKIPIHFDDFPLYKRGVSYGEWERQGLASIDENDFTSFGLHDCYADLWLSHYSAFLKKIERLGTFKTFDQVANETIFAHAL